MSNENLDCLRANYRLSANQGRVIYNGRPARFFTPRKSNSRNVQRQLLGFSPDDVVCLSIGRFELGKGYQYQLEAMAPLHRCPLWSRLRFLWVGDGTLGPRLRTIAGVVAKDQLILLEPLDDVIPLLDAADLLVHTPQHEGLPLVVLEAMARSLPVIATAVSGIPEALGECGLLLANPQSEPARAQHLAEAICALSGDPKRRAELGAAAASRAAAHFTEAPMLARWSALLNEVLL